MKAKLALIQMQFDARPEVVREALAKRIHEAANNGAQIVCFPELATSIYFCHEMDASWQSLAEAIPGPATEVACQAARETRTDVILPLYEFVRSGELYNAAVLISASGEIIGKYRKNIIPLAHSKEMDGFEKYYFRPGNLGHPVFETTCGIKIGIIICYERHFPEGPRILGLSGADLLLVPTATGARRNVWDIELRGHAVANMVWVAGVNRVGRDIGGGPVDFYGSSLVADPEGEVVAAAGATGEEIVYAQIDTDMNRRLRETYGWIRDRRPELYSQIVTP